jgi:arabinose-5-phosphate isomerase
MADDVAKILEAEARGVLGVPLDNPYEQVIALLHATAKAHGKVVVTGVGKAGDVGRKIVSAWNSTGISAVFLSPLDARHGDLGVIGAHDMLFLISNSGKTTEITELVALAHRLHPRIKTVCLTGNPRSPLARAADLVLATGNPKEVCPLGLTPTTSVLAMLAIADVLTVLSMTARRYSPADYQKRHHSGYLGSKAKKLAKKRN